MEKVGIFQPALFQKPLAEIFSQSGSFLTRIFKVASIRVCQPAPVERKEDRTSVLYRTLTLFLARGADRTTRFIAVSLNTFLHFFAAQRAIHFILSVPNVITVRRRFLHRCQNGFTLWSHFRATHDRPPSLPCLQCES